MSIRSLSVAAGAAVFLLAACTEEAVPPTSVVHSASAPPPQLLLSASASGNPLAAELGIDLAGAGSPAEAIAAINDALTASGADVLLQKMEWVTTSGGDQAGQTVFAEDRMLRLDSRWVANDARRGAVDDRLTQLVFQGFAIANGAIDGEPAIDASFDTWNAETCTDLEVVKVTDTGVWPSALLTLGGVVGDPFLADISTIGFLPGVIFDLVLGPGASTSVLGVTFTFTWIDPETGLGSGETALKEIWYNDNFLWTTAAAGPGVDIETVALHENGHALELGHFGRVAIVEANNRLNVSPRAVMNAFVLGTQRELLTTDRGAFCSNFGRWPR